MPYYANVYNVLVASPSDVPEEREIIVEVIHEWNARNAAARQLVLLPLMWETHSASEYNVKPQDVINKEVVNRCDFAIGAFWSRLGTPTDNAESGTVEEINRISAAGKLVMLYFSKKHLPQDHDADQFARLKNFKSSVRKNGLIGEYFELGEFKSKLSRELDIKMREAPGMKENVEKFAFAKTTIINDDGGEEHTLRGVQGQDQETAQKEGWKIKILKILFTNEESAAKRSHSALGLKLSGMPPGMLSYFLDELMDENKIRSNRDWQGAKFYDITAYGRKWIVENGIIKITA